MDNTVNKTYDERVRRLDDAVMEHDALAQHVSDWLFQHPEISGEEVAASGKIVEILREQGYRVEYPAGGLDTAFIATYGEQQRNRTLALLVEYDALPDIGHACGHNVSAGISLLAGLALRPFQDELDCNIVLIGTPAEERGGGKVTLIEHGVFDDVDVAMMVHAYDRNVVSPVCLALRGKIYTFSGVPAHAAASPWEGKNALNGVQLFFHGVDMLRQHVTPDVRMHGIVLEGGTIPNTVPKHASCELYVRARDKDYAAYVQSLADDCARGAAIATQTRLDTHASVQSYSDLKRNEPGLRALSEVFCELDLESDDDPDLLFASTDAGNVSYLIPTFHPCLQIAPTGTELHTPEFASCAGGDEGRKAIATGAKLLGRQALKIFGDDALASAVAKG